MTGKKNYERDTRLWRIYIIDKVQKKKRYLIRLRLTIHSVNIRSGRIKDTLTNYTSFYFIFCFQMKDTWTLYSSLEQLFDDKSVWI